VTYIGEYDQEAIDDLEAENEEKDAKIEARDAEIARLTRLVPSGSTIADVAESGWRHQIGEANSPDEVMATVRARNETLAALERPAVDVDAEILAYNAQIKALEGSDPWEAQQKAQQLHQQLQANLGEHY